MRVWSLPASSRHRPPAAPAHRSFNLALQQQQQSQLSPCVHSVNRRDVLISTGSLVFSTDTAVASENPQHQADVLQAAPEAASPAALSADRAGATRNGTAAAEQPPAHAMATDQKRKKARLGGKKQQQQQQKTKAPLKPPGAVPRVELADGLEVSKVIRGCWQLDGQHKGDQPSDRTAGAAAIEDLDLFCRAGMFTFDTADNYGPSEAVIGQHMRLNPATAYRTKALTKLTFMTPPSQADLRKQSIEYRIRSSIARLGVMTLDMVQLHWEPAEANSSRKAKSVPGFVQAAKVLKQLQQEGLVRAVGVSNFDVPMLMTLLDAGVKPVSNQVSYSVLDRRPSLFLARFCEKNNIPLLCYGTLAGGFLAERYFEVPANKVVIDTISKARYGTLLKQLGGWSWVQDMLRVLHEVGEKHGVSASCVAARWVLQQAGVAAIVMGARNASHIRDAQRLFSFELDDIDLLDIDAAYEEAHQPTTDVYAWERGGDW